MQCAPQTNEADAAASPRAFAKHARVASNPSSHTHGTSIRAGAFGARAAEARCLRAPLTPHAKALRLNPPTRLRWCWCGGVNASDGTRRSRTRSTPTHAAGLVQSEEPGGTHIAQSPLIYVSAVNDTASDPYHAAKRAGFQPSHGREAGTIGQDREVTFQPPPAHSKVVPLRHSNHKRLIPDAPASARHPAASSRSIITSTRPAPPQPRPPCLPRSSCP